jgi:cupin 2 domain-containing protein
MKKNIYENIPENISEELFEVISKKDDVVIERIISDGHATPEGFWYDQKKHEFVILLKGSAEILFEDNSTVKLKPGDYMTIPPHKKHRVERTSDDEKTVWLAVHY